jgi:hypothetical protein
MKAQKQFQVSKNEKARAQLHKREVAIRREQLERNIRLHKDDVGLDPALAKLLNRWRAELMELKCI